MKTVAGIFDSSAAADRAISELMDIGFSKGDISLLMSDKTRNTLFRSSDEGGQVAKGGIAGAAAGGALGALIGGLTAAGAIVTSGGTLLVAGPIVAALSGTGAGAIAGGLTGALISAGLAEDEAEIYSEEIERGKAVVILHLKDENKAPLAEFTLRNAGATIKAA